MNKVGHAFAGAHRTVAFVVGSILSLTCLRAEINAPIVRAGELPGNAVRVEILEGLPDEPKWKFTNPPVNETYWEPAFGFVALPTKYSAKGIKVDRAAPFLVRAS